VRDWLHVQRLLHMQPVTHGLQHCAPETRRIGSSTLTCPFDPSFVPFFEILRLVLRWRSSEDRVSPALTSWKLLLHTSYDIVRLFLAKVNMGRRRSLPCTERAPDLPVGQCAV
jgi:hypothetical protein